MAAAHRVGHQEHGQADPRLGDDERLGETERVVEALGAVGRIVEDEQDFHGQPPWVR
jgi:hypothetical protein